MYMTPKGGEGSFCETDKDAFASNWGGWENQTAQRRAKSSKSPRSQTLSPNLSEMGDSPDGVPATKSEEKGKEKAPLATSTPARSQGQGKSQVRCTDVCVHVGFSSSAAVLVGFIVSGRPGQVHQEARTAPSKEQEPL